MVDRPDQLRPEALGCISMAGFGRASRGLLLRPDFRVFGQYAVVYVHAGEGRYVDESGLDRAIVPGDLIYVFPTLGHRYGPLEGATWEELFLVFDGPVCRLWQEAGLLDPRRPVGHLTPIGHWRRRWESVLVTAGSRAGPP